ARSTYDGAVPSGVGVMFSNLVSLGRITREDHWIERAVGALRALSSSIDRSGIGAINSTRSLLAMMAMRELVADRYVFLPPAPASEQSAPSSGPVHVFVSEESIRVSD